MIKNRIFTHKRLGFRVKIEKETKNLIYYKLWSNFNSELKVVSKSYFNNSFRLTRL